MKLSHGYTRTETYWSMYTKYSKCQPQRHTHVQAPSAESDQYKHCFIEIEIMNFTRDNDICLGVLLFLPGIYPWDYVNNIDNGFP